VAGSRVSGPDPWISGVRLDSRRVRPGDLFCALKGERFDGRAFVPQAIESGAVAVLAETGPPAELPERLAWVRVAHARATIGPIARVVFDRPDAAMLLVGITGTNGKTTVSWMVESIARAAGRRAGRIGTIDAAWTGVTRAADRTTPEATDLYELLSEMRDAGTEIVAMEVSSHALALGRVDAMRFAVAAFLNLGRDHLDFHGHPERYFDAKAILFERLSESDRAIVPDDALGRKLRERTRARVMTFGRSDLADLRIDDVRASLDGVALTLCTSDRRLRVRTPLVGRFQAENVAAAAACAEAAGLPDAAVVEGIAALDRVPGRSERIDGGQPFAVWVDYAHTEAALAGVLASARELASGRVLVVFGCGGDRDRGKRAPMGAVAVRSADVVVLTSDNPRSEDPAEILREVEAGARTGTGRAGEVVVEQDRRAAIRIALSRAEPGDVVVVAGKGHETGQTFGNRTEPFDDREEARRGLRELGYPGSQRADA
jgi:UDP-N-acetylmuramoyl-L-alanyl-D-glutamate--2,6-diaminopimelate ligase